MVGRDADAKYERVLASNLHHSRADGLDNEDQVGLGVRHRGGGVDIHVVPPVCDL